MLNKCSLDLMFLLIIKKLYENEDKLRLILFYRTSILRETMKLGT